MIWALAKTTAGFATDVKSLVAARVALLAMTRQQELGAGAAQPVTTTFAHRAMPARRQAAQRLLRDQHLGKLALAPFAAGKSAPRASESVCYLQTKQKGPQGTLLPAGPPIAVLTAAKKRPS